MRQYLIAMGFRIVCFVVAVLVDGWIRWTAIGAAVVLPYIAVVIANATGPREGGEVLAPGPGRSRALPAAPNTPVLHGGIEPEDTDARTD